jgi:hypothetical protein
MRAASGMPKITGFACAVVALCLWLAPSAGPARGDGVTVLAAGDIARCGRGRAAHSGAAATARLLEGLTGTILALGDLAYEDGKLVEFRRCYAPTWGRHKDRTYPVPGNHDYGRGKSDAAGYFAYWGARAGNPDEGFYSFELADWHLIALNSNIEAGPGSAQDEWLARDLAAAKARCILAFWHHTPFSSARRPNDARMRPLLRRLHGAGVSVILAGHDHFYERFAAQDPDGRLDPERGFRAFTVGTGGARRYEFGEIETNSRFQYAEAWGVLRLVLHPRRYDWEFVTVDGRRLDRGSGPCVDRFGE